MARVKRVSVNGVRDLQLRINELAIGFSDDEKTKFSKQINEVIGEAAGMIYDQAKANARAHGLPPQVEKAIFMWNKPSPSTRRRQRNTALVGVARGQGTPSYIEWKAGSGPGNTKSKDGARDIVRKVKKGSLVGMSQASMYEFGTSKLLPKPFYYPAVKATRAAVRAYLRSGILATLQEFGTK